ncbi:hypothetical protein [Mycobacterium uberis]|uniref:hypothetical protein n=1 Tax=Mycobacterium uberis TaxID=2162698 RepID=UPI0014023D3E|nr:hypothetical protein [Mycobacterium uberis]
MAEPVDHREIWSAPSRSARWAAVVAANCGGNGLLVNHVPFTKIGGITDALGRLRYG